MDNTDLKTNGQSFQHFWYQCRRQLIKNIFNKYHLKGHSVLEVGCGAGSQLLALAQLSDRVSGIDIDQEALAVAANQGLTVHWHDIEQSAIDHSSCDVICMFDVLEHIRDDQRALANIYQSLTPGGWLIFSVPAHQFLFSGHDRKLKHFRRYSKRVIRERLRSQKFSIVEMYAWNSWLLPLVILRRLLTRKKISSDINCCRWLNLLFSFILSAETKLIDYGVRMPVGLSIVGVARRLD